MSMYAVIATGGKQYRVAQGERLDVEKLGTDEGEVTFTPVLVVDGDTVHSGADRLSGASVTARVVGEAAGPKINGFTYKPKSNSRRHWGHRQHYATIEITGITAGA
ncbi:MAG: large subunit ribosomal protein [Acidimicrobiaceae bacterium]|jgi:large subunit ribosomal protein L21